MHQKLDNGIQLRGWKITSNKGSIGSIEETKQWEEHTMLPVLPEMVFGKNFVCLERPQSNFKISFSTLDALSAVDHTKAPTIVVKASEEWSKGNAAQLLKLQQEHSLESADALKSFDWTFSTPYQGTLDEKAVVTATEEKINVAKLSEPDPILWYDEVVLYEDELADNGTSHLSLRIVCKDESSTSYSFQRVMPTCLFLLQRLFLRVDGVLFRVLDNRFFLEFHKNYFIHEFTHKEEEYDAVIKQFGPEDCFSKVRDVETIVKILPVKETKLEKIAFD